MEVILLEKIHRLGNLGDQVNVKGGYARNFLLPKGKAVVATEANIAVVDARKEEVRKSEQKTFDDASRRAKQISEINLNILARASKEGKLFGSVGAREIITEAEKQGIAISSAEIRLKNGPLRELGEHKVPLFFHADVDAAITVDISSET